MQISTAKAFTFEGATEVGSKKYQEKE